MRLSAIVAIIALSPIYAGAADSWVNLNDAELRADLQTTLDSIKAQSQQIFTNLSESDRQVGTIQHNTDLIIALDLSANQLITDMHEQTNNHFVTVEDDFSNHISDVGNRFDQLDSRLDAEFSNVQTLFNGQDARSDSNYQIMQGINNQASGINGRDVIGGRSVSGSNLSGQVSSTNSRMQTAGQRLTSNESTLSNLESQINSLRSQANGKTTISEAKNLNVNLSTGRLY